MKITKNKWIWAGTGWFVGLAMGVVIAVLIMNYALGEIAKTDKTLCRVVFDQTLALEEHEALDKLKNGSPAVALYAQDHLIKYVTSVKEIGYVKEENYASIVGLAEARKGRLYEMTGDNEKSSQSYNIALEKFKSAHIKTNIDQMKELMKRKDGGRP
jgi:hypothetical protein